MQPNTRMNNEADEVESDACVGYHKVPTAVASGGYTCSRC